MSVDVVFIHGAGAAGAEAWPHQAAEAEAGWVFISRAGVADDADRDADRVLHLIRAAGVARVGAHLVAHSYGANAALLAARRDPRLVRSLALLEPACFDLARGQPAVEKHIAAMTPIFAVADDSSVSAREFSRMFAAATGMEPPDLPNDELESRVRRLRALSPPWDVGLRPDQDLTHRTLVITGGGSPLYDEVAASLVAAGAKHLILDGAGHRIQDDPRATDALRENWIQGVTYVQWLDGIILLRARWPSRWTLMSSPTRNARGVRTRLSPYFTGGAGSAR